MTDREWGRSIDLIKLPREVYVSLTALKDTIFLYGELIKGNTPLEIFWSVLFNESCQIMLSDNPDVITIETAEMSDHFIYNNLSFAQYSEFRKRLVDALKLPLTDIERLRSVWREHADLHLTWRVSEDQLLVIIKFTPIYPSRDYDTILRTVVNEAITSGEFVPYKYLRVLGLC
jgi:hypothetical protein